MQRRTYFVSLSTMFRVTENTLKIPSTVRTKFLMNGSVFDVMWALKRDLTGIGQTAFTT